MEGGHGGIDPELTPDPNPNTNLHLKTNTKRNPDPKPGHLQLHPTPAPSDTLSPALPAGVQENTDPVGKVLPNVGAGQRTQTGGATTSCNHNGGAANTKANTPLL